MDGGSFTPSGSSETGRPYDAITDYFLERASLPRQQNRSTSASRVSFRAVTSRAPKPDPLHPAMIAAAVGAWVLFDLGPTMPAKYSVAVVPLRPIAFFRKLLWHRAVLASCSRRIYEETAAAR